MHALLSGPIMSDIMLHLMGMDGRFLILYIVKKWHFVFDFVWKAPNVTPTTLFSRPQNGAVPQSRRATQAGEDSHDWEKLTWEAKINLRANLECYTGAVRLEKASCRMETNLLSCWWQSSNFATGLLKNKQTSKQKMNFKSTDFRFGPEVECSSLWSFYEGIIFHSEI